MEFKQNVLEKAHVTITVTKAKSLQHGQFEAVISTDDLDRHGEHVSIKGMAIPKNQVIKMYYNHETTGTHLPIGKWLKVWKTADGKLMGLGEVDIEDEFALKIYKKVLKGYIDSISVGFFPLEYDGDTSTWTKSTLAEASLVAEPANVNAVVTQKDLGFSKEEFAKSLSDKLLEVEAEDNARPNHSDASSATDLTEIKSAIKEMKSSIGALEAAVKASNDSPAIKQLIKVRVAAKQVDKASEQVNTVIRLKLKGSK